MPGLPPDQLIIVTEIDCPDPGCLGPEVIIAIDRPDGFQAAIRLKMRLTEVDQEDIRGTLASVQPN